MFYSTMAERGYADVAGSVPADFKTDLKTVRKMLSHLPKEALMSESGKSMSISYDKDNVKYINFCPIKTKATNQNIVLKA